MYIYTHRIALLDGSAGEVITHPYGKRGSITPLFSKIIGGVITSSGWGPKSENNMKTF